MSLLVKICGVTTAKDATMAAELGADAIGVNFWPGSKRYVDPANAGTILAAIPAGVLKVGVFVDAPAKRISRFGWRLWGSTARSFTATSARPTSAMLEPARLIRAVRVRDAASFDAEAGWKPALWLYDAFVDGFGGGGVAAPWPLIAERARRPFLLAGGLTPENVAEAGPRPRAPTGSTWPAASSARRA